MDNYRPIFCLSSVFWNDNIIILPQINVKNDPYSI